MSFRLKSIKKGTLVLILRFLLFFVWIDNSELSQAYTNNGLFTFYPKTSTSWFHRCNKLRNHPRSYIPIRSTMSPNLSSQWLARKTYWPPRDRIEQEWNSDEGVHVVTAIYTNRMRDYQQTVQKNDMTLSHFTSDWKELPYNTFLSFILFIWKLMGPIRVQKNQKHNLQIPTSLDFFTSKWDFLLLLLDYEKTDM